MNSPLVCLAVALLITGSAGAQSSEKKAKASSTAKPAATAPSGPRNVSIDEAEKLLKERPDVIVVDVRTKEEFEMGHIAGAQNASILDDEFADRIREFEGKPILVHCAAGTRSARAVQQLAASGKYPEIFHMFSGLSAWQDQGKPVVKTPKAAK